MQITLPMNEVYSGNLSHVHTHGVYLLSHKKRHGIGTLPKENCTDILTVTVLRTLIRENI